MRSKSLLRALFVSMVMTQLALAQSQCILPQVANGVLPDGSFRTTFVIVNNTGSTAAAVLALTKDNGAPLEVTVPGLGAKSTFTLILPPGATRILQTDGSGSLVSGAATVTSNVPVGVSAVFTLFDPEGNFLSEAGVGDSPALSQFTLPVQVNRTLDTGIALFNPSTSTVTLSLRLLEGDGALVGTTQLALPPKNHTARFVSELFPIADLIGGSIAVEGTGKIAALALLQNMSGATPTYTNLPVTSGVTRGTAGGTGIGAKPIRISGLTGIVAVTRGAALRGDGTVWALSATKDADRIIVAQIEGLTGVVAVSGSVALKGDGTVWDFSGRQIEQVSGLSDVVMVHQSTGGSCLALKRDGSVWAWNAGNVGAFEVSKARGIVAVTALAFGGLALMGNGTVWVMPEFSSDWFQLQDLNGIVAIDGAFWEALGLKSDGAVWELDHPTSRQVQGIPRAMSISSGDQHCMALAQNGTVWEWGVDYYSHKTTWPTPRQVGGLNGVAKIAASGHYSFALLGDGTVWVWGYD